MIEPVRINIKPLSVNQVWQGKRFKTPIYKKYEKELLLRLPNIDMPKEPFRVHFEWGFSSIQSDIDNPTKPIQDIMQKRYVFNDCKIHELIIKKVKVAKGDEYVQFFIESIND